MVKGVTAYNVYVARHDIFGCIVNVVCTIGTVRIAGSQ